MDNAAKGKLITEQIMIALKEECELNGEKTTKMRALASTLVDSAINGDMTAAREVLNRAEGAVAQAITVDPGHSLLSILDELEKRRDMRDATVIDESNETKSLDDFTS